MLPTDLPTRQRKGTPGAPYRAKPADFREQFVRRGWDVVDHYATGWKVVDRWVEEEGRESLRRARKAYRQIQCLQRRVAAAANAMPSLAPSSFVSEMLAIADRQAAIVAQRAAQ
ncbi:MULTISPECIES: hypothetical protein [unclassified Sphingomonas]|uniref:hypothetical protein n=1 Tax=unclassified Sphingomonas TaxID=196159 RepID=UPI00226ABDCF|nr:MULTISPECIES: hypothetical protein [unclassified Sphingomonas]